MSAYDNQIGGPWPEDDGSHTQPHGDKLFVKGEPLPPRSSYHPDDEREIELDEEAYRTW